MKILPDWANEVIASYESGASDCFLLHGNVADNMLIRSKDKQKLGSLPDFVMESLLPRFDVIITYDMGAGLRVERGSDTFSEWPTYAEDPNLPHRPLDAARSLTHYMLYCRNLQIMGKKAPSVAVIIKQAHMVCPALPNLHNYELSSLAALLKGWADDGKLKESNQAVFLISENLNGVHPLITDSPRVSHVEIKLPESQEIATTLDILAEKCPIAMKDYIGQSEEVASRLRGATLSSIESLLLRLEHDKETLNENQLANLKKKLVERDCDGLIDFIEPDRTLDDCIGMESVKTWLRQDIALWKQDELDALPMGYLFCGPVGTGKTYLSECLAGEAGVPVVTMRNFRDKWVGSTEANLEKIFSLLHALGRCIVFVDEADQALGKRQGGSGDSGVSSRVYSMMAKEMSNTRNRGKIIWVLASSRPDLIEIDLKRPGRVDVKIPLFPSINADESFLLIRALCKRRKLFIEKSDVEKVRDIMPNLLTPGAAEAIAVKAFRINKTSDLSPIDSLKACLTDYIPPVPEEILKFQMRIAAEEATDASLVSDEIEALIEN